MTDSQTTQVAAGGRVIVCGGGFSGLVTAVSALEAGAQVTLLEKAPQPGGSALLSGGLLWTVADYDDVRRETEHGDPILQWMVNNGIDAGSAWLFSQGVKGGPEEPFFNVGRGWRIEPAQAIEALTQRFLSLGGNLCLSCPLDTLAVADGRVNGVRCVGANGMIDFVADAVVMATGGFQGNADLVTRYIVPDPTRLRLRASPWSTGDGMLAAAAVGAAQTPGLDKFYGHALCDAPERTGVIDFRALSQYYGRQAVALNLQGRRFCDESEGLGEEILNYHLAHQPDGRGWYVIDEAMLPVQPMQGMDLIVSVILERARSAGANVLVGHSIEALAVELGKQGVPAAVAADELRQFNAAIETGCNDRLWPTRRSNRRPLIPPLYAVPVKAAITFTMGGLAIDEHARVQRRAGSSAIGRVVPPERAHATLSDGPLDLDGYRAMAIPGLYAAGCNVGNVHHKGYLGGLACGLVVGRVAGQQAAAFARRQRTA